MIWYVAAISLHLLAAMLWVGLMLHTLLLGSLGAGRLVEDTAERLRRLAWPALGLLALSGIYLLYYQGVTLHDVVSGNLFRGRFGNALAAKLLLVAVLAGLQLVVVRRDPRTAWPAVIGSAIVVVSAFMVR